MTVGKIALTNNNKTADNRLIARFSAVFLVCYSVDFAAVNQSLNKR